jgi:hypothetical protein
MDIREGTGTKEKITLVKNAQGISVPTYIK